MDSKKNGYILYLAEEKRESVHTNDKINNNYNNFNNMNSFDEILSSILISIEEDPSANIDDLLAKKMNELGLSEEGIKTLAETNSYLETYHETYLKLQKAKSDEDEPATRDEWLQTEILNVADKHNLTDDQKEQLVSELSSACRESLNSTITKGE